MSLSGSCALALLIDKKELLEADPDMKELFRHFCPWIPNQKISKQKGDKMFFVGGFRRKYRFFESWGGFHLIPLDSTVCQCLLQPLCTFSIVETYIVSIFSLPDFYIV